MSTFRTPPRGLARLLARLPIWLYRIRLGWLLGHRFLLLTHIGRKTGVPRRTVLEVVDHHRPTGTYFVAAAWGERAQWLRNVQRNPEVGVSVGRRRLSAVAEQLPADEAERVLRTYANRHRIAMRALARLLGSDDIPTLARTIPIVALRPARSSEGAAGEGQPREGRA